MFHKSNGMNSSRKTNIYISKNESISNNVVEWLSKETNICSVFESPSITLLVRILKTENRKSSHLGIRFVVNVVALGNLHQVPFDEDLRRGLDRELVHELGRDGRDGVVAASLSVRLAVLDRQLVGDDLQLLDVRLETRRDPDEARNRLGEAFVQRSENEEPTTLATSSEK